MNKFSGCLVFMLAVLLALVGWMLYPASRYEALSNQLLQASQARHLQEQQVARSESNAYIDPAFLGYWGRPGLEATPDSLAEEKLTLLAGLSDLEEGAETDLERRWKDPKVRERMDAFGEFYPKLRKVCRQPHLVVPMAEPQTILTKDPPWLKLRRILLIQSAYAEYLVLAGKTAEALQVSHDQLRLSRLVCQQQTYSIRSMVGASCQSMAQQTLAMILCRSRLVDSLEETLEVLETTQLAPTLYADCLEAEYCSWVRSIPKLQHTSAQSGTTHWLSRVPGIEAREQRLYKNDFLHVIEQLHQGLPVDTSWTRRFGMTDWILGRHSILAAIGLMNFSDGDRIYHLVRQRQAFLHGYVALLRAQNDQGKPPESLQQFLSSGYRPLPGSQPADWVYQPQGKSFQLALSASEMPYSGSWPEDTEMQEWSHLVGQEWRLRAP